MVAGEARYHEFTLFMHSLCHVDAIFNEKTWVDQSIFMSYKLRTILRLLRILTPEEVFESLVRIQVNSIPQLRFSVVQIVNGVQVLVFLVPAKHSFPRAYVDIRRIYSGDYLVSQALAIIIYS